MPTYEQLYYLRLGNLREAADRWRETSSKLKGLHTSFEDEVKRPFRDANWTQPVLVAGAAGQKASAVEREFDDAPVEASGIAGILASVHAKLKAARDDLHRVADVEAEEKGLHVGATGRVTPRNDLSKDRAAIDEPDYQDLVRKQQSQCDALVAKLDRILARAAEADEEACFALRKNLGGDKQGFNDKVYTSLDAADAARDSAQALVLAGRGSDMSDKELTQLNELLKEHRNDKLFSEKFATGLGPKGTLTFWSEMADSYPKGQGGNEDRAKLLKQLQKELGTTLGTATRSGSDAMKEWKQEIIKLGPWGLEGAPGTPYGFQVMSSLMRNGEYDSEFLQDYGKSLVDHEEEYGDIGLDKLWTGPLSTSGLNVGSDGDRGNDPMTGFLEALGHNPEASAEFLGDADNFDYLVGGSDESEAREWPEDSTVFSDESKIAGYDSLGHALESATLGIPYDTMPPHPDRSMDGAADIMEKVVQRYGADPSLMSDRDGLSDSIAKMGASYIDDLNWAAADAGSSGSVIGRDELFPVGDRDRMDVSPRSATDFLYALGQDKDSHAALSLAQHLYTSGRLADADISSLEAQEVARWGGYVHGSLDQGRMEQIDSDYEEEGAEKDREIAESTSWKSTATSVAVGAGVGLIAVPTGGVGAIAVPIVAGAAEEAVNTYFGSVFDEEAERQSTEAEDERSQKQRMNKSEYKDSGLTVAQSPLNRFILENNVPQDERGGMLASVRGGYYDGAMGASS